MLSEGMQLKVLLWSDVVNAIAPTAAAAADADAGSSSSSNFSSAAALVLKGADVLLVDVHADLPLLYW